ncbi:MAG: GNAT family N-acetyltransferase [Chloroflexi bacterium]|nr:GNAT family N-acetyltransferase [Chloroflexota bacterium]
MKIEIVSQEEQLQLFRATAGALAGEQGLEDLEAVLNHPRFQNGFLRLATVEGKVAGLMMLRHDRLAMGRVELDACTVVQTLVAPENEEEEVITALMNNALDFMFDEGFALSLTRGSVDLYQRFGFVVYQYLAGCWLPAQHRTANVESGGQWRLRTFEPYDLFDLVSLYENNYSYLPESVVRTRSIWEVLTAPNPDIQVVVDSLGRVLAYAWIDQRENRNSLRVIEAASADGGAVAFLLHELQERCIVEGLQQIYLALSPQHPVVRAALRLGGETRLVGAQLEAPNGPRVREMARILNPVGLLQQMSQELQARLLGSVYTSWTGNLRLDSGEGAAVLSFIQDTLAGNSWEGRSLRGSEQGESALMMESPIILPYDTPSRLLITDDSWAPLEAKLTPELFAQMVLGYVGGAEVVGTPDTDISELAFGLLSLLFPATLPTTEHPEWSNA